MLTKTLIFNWKSNPQTTEEVQTLWQIIQTGLENILVRENQAKKDKADLPVKVVVCPPNMFLRLLQNSEIPNLQSVVEFGIQDISVSSGTAQISPMMARSVGCYYAIIGHSELRSLCRLSNQEIAQKAACCFKFGVIPIVCIGYQQTEMMDKLNFLEISDQIDTILDRLQQDELTPPEIIFAYEPVWAIGSNQAASIKTINEVIDFCKQRISSRNQENGQNYVAKFFYGGAVNSQNLQELSWIDSVDGFLIGRASLSGDEVIKMIDIIINK